MFLFKSLYLVTYWTGFPDFTTEILRQESHLQHDKSCLKLKIFLIGSRIKLDNGINFGNYQVVFKFKPYIPVPSSSNHPNLA